MALIPQSAWGLLYMGLLFASMLPCVASKPRRTFAITLIMLWLVTRISLQPGSLGFSYQATALSYTVGALVVLYSASFSTQSVLIAICLAVVSLAGLLASWGVLDLDTASSFYELFGVFAMIFIIGPKDHGYLRNVSHLLSMGNPRRLPDRYRHNRDDVSL